MKPRNNGLSRSQKSNFQGDGPNWILIAGGALLSTLSIRLGFRLKQALDREQQGNTRSNLKGNGKSTDRRKSCGYSNVYSFSQDDDGCFNNSISGSEGMVEMKHPHSGQILTETDMVLPLVTVPPEYNKDNGVIWTSSPDRLELPPKPFHHSNCSDSPCVSESGSDVFSKQEVIHKLRKQLKRRDDMILEMQDQIVELQNSLNAQLAHSIHLQSQVDATNRELFDSEREIQRLRKAIADHCVAHVGTTENPSTIKIWPSEGRNGHTNGYIDSEKIYDSHENGKGDGERIEMLKREVGELKEVIDGKEYLLQNYKEQKAELANKIKELQQRLDSQLPNIL